MEHGTYKCAYRSRGEAPVVRLRGNAVIWIVVLQVVQCKP